MKDSSAPGGLEGSLPTEPASGSDWAAYYNLRWRVLREPWQQPRGSERDDLDPLSIHLMLKSPAGDVVAIGRIHLNSPDQAQVRYMAVNPPWRSRGAGSRVLTALEDRARVLGADEIVLNARSGALNFYLRHGYSVEGDAMTLFGTVKHARMRKRLQC